MAVRGRLEATGVWLGHPEQGTIRAQSLVGYAEQKMKCFRKRTILCQRTKYMAAKTEGGISLEPTEGKTRAQGAQSLQGAWVELGPD